jgi:hypothetical protein
MDKIEETKTTDYYFREDFVIEQRKDENKKEEVVYLDTLPIIYK